MLRLDDVWASYGSFQALFGVSLEVAAGEAVAVIGPNGAGKTTLLRAISKLIPIGRGRITMEGTDLATVPAHQVVARGIAQVPEGRQVFAPLSVEDNLRLGAFVRRDAEIAADLANVYETFPALAEKRHVSAGSLSGGQQQMLAIGRALMARPSLLLLDEPSMGLAPFLVEQIFAIIGDFKRRGLTVLLVEQNAHAALAIADRGYVIEGGRITMTGTGHALREDERVRAAYLGL